LFITKDYAGKGVDQLLECIDKIKNSPEDRRIIMTAWNPADLDKMVFMIDKFKYLNKHNHLMHVFGLGSSAMSHVLPVLRSEWRA
jgi:hypothetical protein